MNGWGSILVALPPPSHACMHVPAHNVVQEFTNVPDGRLFVTNKGKERFRVINIVKEKPVLVCEVEVLPEEEETEEVRAEPGAFCVCVCARARVCVRVCVCVCERERERESQWGILTC